MEETSTTSRYQDIATQVDIQSQAKPDGRSSTMEGFFQVFGEDYDQTYSPVAKFTLIRTVLAISAQLGLHVRQMDVDTAFLIAPIKEDIHNYNRGNRIALRLITFIDNHISIAAA